MSNPDIKKTPLPRLGRLADSRGQRESGGPDPNRSPQSTPGSPPEIIPPDEIAGPEILPPGAEEPAQTVEPLSQP